MTSLDSGLNLSKQTRHMQLMFENYSAEQEGEDAMTGEIGDTANNPTESASQSNEENDIMNDTLEINEQTETQRKRQHIQHTANEIIEATNFKRKRDSEMLKDLKKTAEYQLYESLLQMQRHMHNVYERQEKEMQQKVQELSGCLDRTAKLEQELAEFRKALQMLYQDIS